MSQTHNKNREALRANTYTTKQAMADVRDNVCTSFSGSLATICREDHPLAGYPVSSVVPFMLDDQFRPIILIANIAEHTGNAMANPKASIFLREPAEGGDVQTQWRICMIGDLLAVPEEEIPAVRDKYLAHYPKARHYDDMHDFHFFRLEIKKYRVIMGFGDIRWVAGYAPFTPCPFSDADKTRMLTHMNEDHADAMRGYLKAAGVGVQDYDEVVMVDLHQYGFVLRHRQSLNFIPFEEEPQDAMAVRKALVAMAKA